MQKVFEAYGYQFTIVTPNDSEPHFIAKEVSEALGYSKSFSLAQYFDDKLIITKENGLPSIKDVLGELYKRTSKLALIPASALQEFLLRRSDLPKAKELGDKLYEILSKSYTVQPELYDGKKLEDHPFFLTIHSEVEAEGLGKEFAGWYFERGFKSSYFRSWNRSERRYNWQMSQSWVLYLASLAIKPSLIQLAQKRDSSSFTHNDITL